MKFRLAKGERYEREVQRLSFGNSKVFEKECLYDMVGLNETCDEKQ